MAKIKIDKKKKKAKKGPGKPKVDGDVQSKSLQKTLVFPLTKDDKARILDRRTELEEEIEELQKEAKSKSDEFKNAIAPLEKELDTLSEVARAGEEERTVECVEEMDFLNGEVRYVFEGEIHHRRPMESHEYQMQIHMGDRAQNRGTDDLPQSEEQKTAGEDIADAIREETSKRTKHSATDGPRAN